MFKRALQLRYVCPVEDLSEHHVTCLFAILTNACLFRPSIEHLTETREFGRFALLTEEWDKLQQMCDFLEPFNSATEVLSGDTYPTLGTVLPTYSYLSKGLNQVKSQYNAGQLEAAAEAMLDKLEKYHRIAVTLDSNYFATILDPRFTLKWFQCLKNWPRSLEVRGRSVLIMKELFLQELHKYRKPAQHSVNTGASDINDSATMTVNPSYKEEIFGWNRSDGQAADEISQNAMEEEANRFLALCTNCSFDVCPLDWWKVHQSHFPTVARMARAVLSIPATSAPSERVFSSGRRTLRWDRSKLSGVHTEALVCLKDFYRKRGHLEVEY